MTFEKLKRNSRTPSARRLTPGKFNTLHHKNKRRAMSFSIFLDKMQKMFNIFEKENEPISEQAKICMLHRKVEHPQLQDAVNALHVCASMSGCTFTECADHLSVQVSELPDNQSSRKISGSATNRSKDPKRIRGGGAKGPKVNAQRMGIYMPDGNVYTGYYSENNPRRIPESQSCGFTTSKPNNPHCCSITTQSSPR
jgi:hypothetical protein